MNNNMKKNNTNRLVEMFERVNKIKLNENQYNTSEIISNVIQQISSNEIDVENTNTQSNNNETYVSINAKTKNNEKYNLKFKVILTQEDDGVYNISEVNLIDFKKINVDNNIEIDLTENDLREFNNKFGNMLPEFIEKFVDVQSDAPQEDDLMEAISMIDNIKKEVSESDEDDFNSFFEFTKSKLNAKDDRDVVKHYLKNPNSIRDIEKQYSQHMMHEDNDLNIDDVQNQREVNGDVLDGGLGDEKMPTDFNPDEVLKGIEVEMEHTDNPKIALDIALDHLTEIPDYYTRLNAMETDAETNLTNKLLGFK